jgi:hypothetical protein
MHYKQNNKESKTYVQGLRPFNKTLPHGLKSILKKNGYNYSEIINKWSNLVGDRISKCCSPKSIKMNNGNSCATLIVAVKRGDEITVEYSKKDIINKINSYFGYQLISEIKLKSFNAEVKKIKKNNNFKYLSKNLKKKVNQVKNEKIRNSLNKLIDEIKND